jgi:uncharacterized protein
MKWKGKRKSSNIEDRRGQSSRGGGGLSGINPMLLGPLIRLLFSKKGLIIVAVFFIFSFITGNNPLNFIGQFFTGGTNTSLQPGKPYNGSEEENKLALFSQTILANTEDVWNGLIKNYREPTLVLFSNSVSSACGMATSATGPFYCPGDEKLYIDLGFFEEMEKQLNAPGDFAQAYVIAHEVGHHIQKINGLSDKMNRLRQQMSKTEYNKYSVRVELQADFYAGVWAHHSQQMMGWMENGDLEEAINAANAIGDDRLQKNATGRVVPDSFTHGTSEQRMRWFMKGYKSGNLNEGDTFSANPL